MRKQILIVLLLTAAFATITAIYLGVFTPHVSRLTSATFPAVDPLILGDCTPEIHNRYAVVGPDGQTYRTWHPVTVPRDPSNPAAGACSFAHEHGDDPRQGSFGDSPPFGYAAHVAAMPAEIARHVGFKVFYHPLEGSGLGDDAEWRTVFHQGTAGAARLAEQYHSVQIDIRDGAGRLTQVQAMGDTGALSAKCEERDGERMVVDGGCLHSGIFYEVWNTSIRIGERFSARPGLATHNAMTYMAPGDLARVFPVSAVRERLPLGHPDSLFLGNAHVVEHPRFRWNNDGAAVFWTDGMGAEKDASACDARHCLQQRVPSPYVAQFDDDRVFSGRSIPLPLGAPGGN